MNRVGYDESDAVTYHQVAEKMYEKHQLHADGYLLHGKPFGIYTHLLSFLIFGKSDTSILRLNAIFDTLTLLMLAYVGKTLAGIGGAIFFVLFYGVNAYSVSLVRVGLLHTAVLHYFMIVLGCLYWAEKAERYHLKRVLHFIAGVFSAISLLTHGTIINMMFPLLLVHFIYQIVYRKASVRELVAIYLPFLAGGASIFLLMEIQSLRYRDDSREFIRNLLGHRTSNFDDPPSSFPAYLKAMWTVLPFPALVLLLCLLSTMVELIRSVRILKSRRSPLDLIFMAWLFALGTLLCCSIPFPIPTLSTRLVFFTMLPISVLSLLFVARTRSDSFRCVEIAVIVFIIAAALVQQAKKSFAFKTAVATDIGKAIARSPHAFVYQSGYPITGIDLYHPVSHLNVRTFPYFFDPILLDPTQLPPDPPLVYFIYMDDSRFHYHHIHKYIFENKLEYIQEWSNERYYVFRDPDFRHRIRPYEKGIEDLREWIEQQDAADLVLYSGVPLTTPKTVGRIVDFWGNEYDAIQAKRFIVFNTLFYSRWFHDIKFLRSHLRELVSFFHAYRELRKENGFGVGCLDHTRFGRDSIYDCEIDALLELLSRCKQSGDSRCIALSVTLPLLLQSPMYPATIRNRNRPSLEELRALMNVQFLFSTNWFPPISLDAMGRSLQLIDCFIHQDTCGQYRKVKRFHEYVVFENMSRGPIS